MLRLFVYFLLSTIGIIQTASAAKRSPFHVTSRYALAGQGDWDYITFEPDTKNLFVAHADRVLVVSSTTGEKVGEILGTDGVHGVAFDGASNLGFSSNGRASTVTIFNYKTLEVLSTVPVQGENPDAILFDNFSKNVFAFNGKSHDVSIIDPVEKKFLSKISLPGKPEFAVSDGEGEIFVNIENLNSLVVIDVDSQKVKQKYSLKNCKEPNGLSIDLRTRRLFVGCSNRLMVILEADSGKIIKTFPVGSGVDATAFDPKNKLIFVSAGEGQVSVIQELSANKFKFLENADTAKGARTMAVDPESGKLFLPTSKGGSFMLLVLGQ